MVKIVMKDTNTENLWSINDIATELGTSLKAIRRYVASGQLAAVQSGTKYSIPESSYKAFCDKYTCVDATTGKRKIGNIMVQFLPGLGVDPEEKFTMEAA